MYKSNCYNFDWLVSWLSNNINEDPDTANETTAKHIAKNFSRIKFEVTEQDVVEAFKIIGYKCRHSDGQYLYKLDRDSEAFKQFWKSYD